MKLMGIIIVWVFSATDSFAAVFCVSDADSFRSALSAASENGEADHIKLKTGDYDLTGSTAPRYFLNEDFDLTISGGWGDFNNIPCLVRNSVNPFDTVLDAGNETAVLLFLDNNQSPDSDANFSINTLSISSGINESTQSNTFAGGLTFWFPDIEYSGEILIDRVLFIGNNAVKTAALKVHHSRLTTIRNSVFTLNKTDNGVGVVNINLSEPDDSFYFINNTVVNNSYDLAQPTSLSSAGLFVTNAKQGYIANNLFWNNQGEDISLFLSSPIIHLYNNNFQSFYGTADFAADNMSQAPNLAPQLLDFTPQAGSPLIDQGKAEPLAVINDFELEWGYGTQDFDGFSRVINQRVDIGAVESAPETPVFKNGFD